MKALSTYAALLARAIDLHRVGNGCAGIAAILNREAWRPPKTTRHLQRPDGAPPSDHGRCRRRHAGVLTLQDRLPKELKLAGISTIEAANRWLSETYMAAHNKQFAIDAEAQEG